MKVSTVHNNNNNNVDATVNECRQILCNISRSVQDVMDRTTSHLRKNIISDVLSWCNSLKSMWNKVWIHASQSSSQAITLCMAWSEFEMKLISSKNFEIYARVLIRRLLVLAARCQVPSTSRSSRNDVLAVWQYLANALNEQSTLNEGKAATFWELLKDEMIQLRCVPQDMDKAKEVDVVSPFSNNVVTSDSGKHVTEFCWEILIRLAPLCSASSPPSWQLLSLLTKRGLDSSPSADHLRELQIGRAHV